MKPLPGHTPIVEARLALEYDIEACLEQLDVSHVHDGVVGVFKQLISLTGDIMLLGNLVLKIEENCA